MRRIGPIGHMLVIAGAMLALLLLVFNVSCISYCYVGGLFCGNVDTATVAGSEGLLGVGLLAVIIFLYIVSSLLDRFMVMRWLSFLCLFLVFMAGITVFALYILKMNDYSDNVLEQCIWVVCIHPDRHFVMGYYLFLGGTVSILLGSIIAAVSQARSIYRSLPPPDDEDLMY